MTRFSVACLLAMCAAGCGSGSDRNPVAEWRFDPDDGQENVLNMSGDAGEVIRAPVAPSLISNGSAITVAAWVYRRAESNAAIVAHDHPALYLGFHRARFKWQIQLGGDRRSVCFTDNRNPAEPGRWHHVAATFDGWVSRLYVDGIENCSDWTFGGAVALSDTPFTLGGYLDEEDGVIEALDGVLEDVRIYDVALSSSDIRTMADAGVEESIDVASPVHGAGMSSVTMLRWTQNCALCHVRGEGGAPVVGDIDAWAPRLAQGRGVLLQHTVEGHNSMPPLGYCMACEQADFEAMIVYMTGAR
ncbi:MAG: c-type cytochrome [Pseudomonadales bacterium]|nr:c-type cytochrome [Pseudomonadales bacterium]MDP6469604.1 c-type cytochrome [Pseudomonadales bacterium]MDP6827445.1 c-type cytochrome [Pseudomonadales bacterium]MDP6972193.1 c-type cytochrome [Pseudomonadales bacterium]|tara:strand:+ start:2127 stop:3032 length:906 start_codon:yes stop_codon:yes gene_type:complete